MSDDKAAGDNYSDHGDAADEKAALHTPEAEAPTKEEPDLDSSKVKFINGGADAYVDIKEKDDGGFCGLTKSELEQYAKDPYWIRVRWIMLILFWVAWIAMLVAAILIIVIAPKCPPRPDLQWWQKSVIYNAQPRSFFDSTKDGNGDIMGVKAKVGYLNSINVNAVRLGPVYQSPMENLGYDISDHKKLNPMFGSMHCINELRIALHNHGMKLIMDFVPNHTSRNHTWFQESLKGGDDNQYKDYYVWHAGKNGGPPNNWLSVYGGSAWTKDDTRGEYYLHQFSANEPDLNLRNEKVLKELDGILTYWLEKGVDGFHIPGAAYLFESANITKDEPSSGEAVEADDHKSLEHTLTMFQPETYEVVTRWHELLDNSTEEGEEPKFLSVEAYGTANQTMGFYEYKEKKGADLPSNMNLLNLREGCNGQCVANLVHAWMNSMSSDKWANWMLGNQENERVASRVGQKYLNAANMLMLLLPGTATTYYGDEIGMEEGEISFADTVDPIAKAKGESDYATSSRDPHRTPMQWNDKTNAGFSEADKIWLPVNNDYVTRNVKVQLAHGAGKTGLEVFTEHASLRKEPSFQWGTYTDGGVANENIYSFIRQAEGFDGYLVAINFGQSPALAEFHAARPHLVPKKAEVAGSTGNIESPSRAADFKVGTEAPMDNIHLMPGEGVVFKWTWKQYQELEKKSSQ